MSLNRMGDVTKKFKRNQEVEVANIIGGEWFKRIYVSPSDHGHFCLQPDSEYNTDHWDEVREIQSKTIDFNKLPVGTLIKVSKTVYRLLENAPEYENSMVCLFLVDPNSGVYAGISVFHQEDCKLVQGRIEPWFGGECPLPDGVEVKVWYRNNMPCIDEAKSLQWGFDIPNIGENIIAYQITGEIV